MTNKQKVLAALVTPVTHSEIEEITGLTSAQVTRVLNDMRVRSGGYQKMGPVGHVHYYLPKSKQTVAGIGESFIYRKVLDLIDTEEWWTRDEVCSILEVEPRTVTNSIRFINRYKHAKVIFEKYGRNKSRYFVVR